MGDGAGDAAYRQGLEEFAFEPQPLLPPTPQQKLIQAQADTAADAARLDMASKAKAIGFPQVEVFRVAGRTEEEIRDLQNELAAQSVLPAEADFDPSAAFPADSAV